MSNPVSVFRSAVWLAFIWPAIHFAGGPNWTPQKSGTTAGFRGLCAVSDRIAWASGTQGTFLRTIDGGETWQAGALPGAASLDFRDVEAFDERTAYLLSIGNGDASRIYKTTDGGQNWALQFKANSRNCSWTRWRSGIGITALRWATPSRGASSF
jgi:photosystem II stability/assembly factor-like uncharacterized protein